MHEQDGILYIHLCVCSPWNLTNWLTCGPTFMNKLYFYFTYILTVHDVVHKPNCITLHLIIIIPYLLPVRFLIHSFYLILKLHIEILTRRINSTSLVCVDMKRKKKHQCVLFTETSWRKFCFYLYKKFVQGQWKTVLCKQCVEFKFNIK